MAKTNNHLVIMAGGVGSRFWPMSTSDKPKQFIDVLGTGKTLLQLTVDRFGSLVKPENIWVVTNQKYAAIVKEQLPDMPEGNILCEPCRRNTAPCIAYVSWRIKSKDPKANIVVTPSDHIVTDKAEFQRVVKECMVFTSETDSIVTLGMKPNRPETGYGYIQADLSTSSLRNKEIFRVDSFREKPDLETAKEYIKKNYYFWNAGIFIWNVNTIVNAFRVYQPAMAKLFESLLPVYGTEKRSTVCSRNVRISLWTMPLWKRPRRFLSVRQTSAGATSVHGAPSTSRARKTFMAMSALVRKSVFTKVITASSTPRRRRKWSFKALTAISLQRTITPCSSAN